ncbi:MAG: mechanosensitive ion channel family protein [Nitrosopumilus sp.]|nr:mechanosensitive ion channel family protein [Nitrosopumilus sp.]
MALSIIYLVFKLVLHVKIVKTIKGKKTKYAFSKIISVLYIAVFLIVLITIWVENPQDITIAYGLAGAGIAIALQDLFKNVAWGIILFLTGIYCVGDRIEVNGKAGDVMDVGILYTTILEIKDWVSGDQATGRLVTIPNGQVLSNNIQNYSKDHNFIWDEIHIPIQYSDDWKSAHNKILEIVNNETHDIVENANREIANLEKKHYLDKRTAEPAIYLSATDNWISFNIRYPTEVRSRRFLRDKITRLILDELSRQKIKIASTTRDIVGFPDVKINNQKDKNSE